MRYRENIDFDYFSIGGEIERGCPADNFDYFTDDDGKPIPKKFDDPEKYKKYIQKKEKNARKLAKKRKNEKCNQ